MINCYIANEEPCIPILALTEASFALWLAQQTPWHVNYLHSLNYGAKPGCIALLPDEQTGRISRILIGVENLTEMWFWGGLAAQLPPGNYRIENELSQEQLHLATMAWAYGAYQYTQYKKSLTPKPKLRLDPQLNSAAIEQGVLACYLVRDLINTPADRLGPGEFAAIAAKIAQETGAVVQLLEQTTELQEQYPMVYAVGKGSERKPCVVELTWGNPQHPKVSLVGKGVCFDTGGLNLKTGQGMRLMKKDMGGAAHALALAQWLIRAQLPIQLRVFIPLVENSVSGSAFRPGDVIKTRKGLTVEIDNTDAEGRLILGDALAKAVEENPELLIDFATLTGAARVALGTDLPAMFCNDDKLANDLQQVSAQQQDPLWRLPLYKPYREMLKSSIADLSNATNSPYAGAITAALFLQEFVPNTTSWMHFDLMAWNSATRPGRPEGGEMMVLRAVFNYLVNRYAGN